MEQPGHQKICFDLEDRPPLSYWEQQHSKSSSNFASVSPQGQGPPAIKPEEWVKAPEFVPRSRQMLSDSFYLDQSYNKTCSKSYDTSYPFNYDMEAESGLCHPVLSTYVNQPQLDYSVYMPNESVLPNAPKKKKRRRPKKAKDATVGQAQKVENEISDLTGTSEQLKAENASKETANSDRQQSAFSESAENISLDYSEDSGSKNQRGRNQVSIDEDLSTTALGGSCPELFHIQIRNSAEREGNLDFAGFFQENDQDEKPGIRQGSSLLNTRRHIDAPSYLRRNVRNYYNPPVRARMHLATFNPEFNTTSSSVVNSDDKEGFIQDCFEGLNVRINNFDEGEELTLSEPDEVSPPRLKRLPWILENNFSQYRKLNAPERVCCAIM